MDEINAQQVPVNVEIGRAQSKEADMPTPAALALNAEWLASLSHELRSPLTAIQGYVSMLLRHKDRISPEEGQEFLYAISEGSDRMASVLDRFFDIAYLEAGTVQLHLLPVDMVQLVQEVLLTVQQECPEKHLALTFKQECDPALPLGQHPFVIQADGLQIRKMLVQLLDNAQKYSAACTPIEVTLSCTSLSQRVMQLPARVRAQLPGQDQGWGQTQERGQAPSLLELTIRDHGIGISVADQERIFERFERVDMELTRQVSGLGLGLTMCKYIVALHHGAIWVESTLGGGSTFHVLLPTECNYT